MSERTQDRLEDALDELAVWHARADDIETVVGFVLGWWPGYEDAVHWGDDMIKEDHDFYMAAKRLDDSICRND